MRIDRRTRGIVAEIAIASVYFPVLCLPQNPSPTFHDETELVILDVQVLHVKTGAPAPALTASVSKSPKKPSRRRSSIFRATKIGCLWSCCLISPIASVVVLQRLAEGAQTALSHFKPSDQVAVMVYSAHAQLIDNFTTDRAQTLAAIQRAAAMKSPEPAYFPNSPDIHTGAEAVRALHEQTVVVAPILLRSAFWEVLAPLARAAQAPLEKSFPPGDAPKYAELSGGQTVGLRGKQPEQRLAQLIDELHARYTITYRPSDPQPVGTFRKIKVTLTSLRAKEWKVLATNGYYRK